MPQAPGVSCFSPFGNAGGSALSSGICIPQGCFANIARLPCPGLFPGSSTPPGRVYAVSLFGTVADLSFDLWFGSMPPLGLLPRFLTAENDSSTEVVMAPARKRRKLPTLIDRGLGLLEVILPRGSQDDPVSTLPPGQRDTGGFWFPTGYTEPGDIFTPAQRRLQAKQRLVQRHRHESIPAAPPIVSRSKAIATDTTPSRP